MKNLLRFLLLSVLLTLSAFAQFSNTIIQQVLTSSSTGISGALPNIGQSVHFFTVQNKNAPAHNCAGTYFSAALQGSYDNVNFYYMPSVVIAAGQSTLGSTYTTRTYQSNGVYPIFRLVMPAVDSVNCLYDAWYSGIISGAFASPLAMIGTNTFTSAVANVFQNFVTKTVAGDNIIVSASGTGGITNISLYTLSVCNTTGPQTVFFSVNGVTLLNLPNMATGQCYVAPVASFPTLSTDYNGLGGGANQALHVNLANSTAVSFQFAYRYE